MITNLVLIVSIVCQFFPGSYVGGKEMKNLSPTELLQLAMNSGAINTCPQLQELLEVYSLNPEDEDLHRHILELCSPSAEVNNLNTLIDPFHPSPTNEFSSGLKIATIQHTGKPFCYAPEQHLHLLVTGTTGSGKSNLAKILVREALDSGIYDVIVMSFSKKEYRTFLKNNLPYFHWSDFKINPLEIFGNPAKAVNVAATILSQSTDTFIGPQNYLGKYIKIGYEKFGIFNGGDEYPSIQDILSLMNEDRPPAYSLEYKRFEMVQDRIYGILHFMGSTVSCRKGFIGDCINNHLFLELDGLQNYSGIIVLPLIYYLRNYLDTIGNSSKIKLVLLEDPHQILPQESKYGPDKGYSFIADLFATGRSRGIIFVLTPQVYSLLPQYVISNTPTKMVTGMDEIKDLVAASKSIGVYKENQISVVQGLQINEAIVKAPGHATPFIVNIDKFECDKLMLTDDELRKHSENIASKFNWIPQPENSNEIGLVNWPRGSKEMLVDIFLRPKIQTAQRYKDLKFGANKGNSIVTFLVEKGYVVKKAVLCPGRGRSPIFHELTSKADEYLVSIGFYKKINKNFDGNITHRDSQEKIALHFRSMKNVTSVLTEKFRSGKRVDIEVTFLNNLLMAVEVQLRDDGAMSNIIKDIAAGYDKVLVLFPSKEILNNAKKKISPIEAMGKERIALDLIQNYI